MNGLGNIADASTTCRDMHSDRNGVRTTAKTRKTVSKTSNKPKLPNSPVGTKFLCIGEADGWGNHADGSNVCRDTQRAGTDAKTAENASRKVKMGQRRSKGKTHLIGSKSKWQSIPSNVNTSAIKETMDTHRKMHRSKVLTRDFESSSLDEVLRCWEILRALRRVLRSRKMAVRMMNVVETWTALSAVATSTQIELKQCSWLQRVSKRATTQELDEMTYQCRPGDL